MIERRSGSFSLQEMSKKIPKAAKTREASRLVRSAVKRGEIGARDHTLPPHTVPVAYVISIADLFRVVRNRAIAKAVVAREEAARVRAYV